MKSRDEYDLPQAIQEWGWKFHHIGIPTKEKKLNEHYLEKFKFSVSGFSESPFGVEWMRFEDDCKMPDLIKNIPHLAFVVEDLNYELKTWNFKVLIEPNPPKEGIRVAMIEHNGAPIELMEFIK
ncbi:MAG: hypothetical protein CVU88_07100 [Firmicutes bacterium HGW-Firmicutes-13]|jgi:hypothetical protein|nr:MAG: hypothetical protein CVV44_19035 [Spirochaetae bacterium HGW-Spirochaetae-1]PKM79184.1 MAG: hypothetical protein CVU88_07100 [Firmicutes bacterium HGW-Firmicutes-13]